MQSATKQYISFEHNDLSRDAGAIYYDQLEADTDNLFSGGENLELVGQIGGSSLVVAVEGNYAYVGIGPRLVIVNISDPTNLTVVGQTSVLPGVVLDVVIAGSYAYVANDDEGGLRVINIANPESPTEISSIDTPGYAKAVAIVGSYAYVADWNAGLRVINIANPQALTEAGYYDTPGFAEDVAIVGDYAYVADATSGLQIIKIANPQATTEVGSIDTPSWAQGVAIAGNYAYVADKEGGLRVINIVNPEAPTEVGSIDTQGLAVGVAIAGSYAYVADYWNGLQIINIANPEAPTEVSSIDTLRASNVAIAGSYAYVADYWNDLQIIDIANPQMPTKVGSIDMPPGLVLDVEIVGNYAYVADGSGGLRVINITNPQFPAFVGSVDTPGYAHRVVIVGSYAYVADWNAGLRVISIANPQVPIEVGSIDTPGIAKNVAIAGGYAYVANDDRGLRIIDIANPEAPSEAGSIDTPGSASSVAIAGSYAYVTDEDKGLRIINIANPQAPTEVGSYDTPGEAWNVAIAGSYAYVADLWSGLRIIDIANPQAPTEVGSYDTPGETWNVAIAGSYALLADRYSLRVINIANPQALSQVGYYDTPDYAQDVAIAGNYAYVADGSGGLVILPFTGELGPTPTATSTSIPTPSATPTNTATYTPIPPTATGTATDTPIPPTATATETPIPPTATETPIPPTATATGTPIPPTATATDTPIPPTATETPIPPTATATETPQPSNTPVTTPTNGTPTVPPGNGDAYEPDDSCAQAQPISIDGSVQEHTFHQQADQDWLRFDVTEGTTYSIEARVPEGSRADVVLQVYDECGGEATPYDSFGPTVRVQLDAPSDGTFYLQLTNYDPQAAGEDVAYDVSVRTLSNEPMPGAVVLVAGRLRANDRLQSNIHQVTNDVYSAFLAHGYTGDRIHYLAHDLRLNPDNNPGTEDVDGLANRKQLEYAITQWATDEKLGLGPDRAFTLYMMDHGDYDKLYLNTSADQVSPEEIDEWLEILEAARPGVKVNVIVEACLAGSFIDAPNSLSKPGRVVITSSTNAGNAYASREGGALFSDTFVQAIDQEMSLYSAFAEAQEVARSWYPDQVAWLDDNGDGFYTPEDGPVAQQRGFAYAGSFATDGEPPYISSLNGPMTIENRRGQIEARVQDDVQGANLTVWAVIYEPSYTPPQPGQELVLEESLPTVRLEDPDRDGVYNGLFTGFNDTGSYRIVVYAVDEDGLQSRPRTTVVQTGWELYLPLLMR